ncbi:uncharacterized protein LOC101454185 isoform X4 [Ceratitis capitata]|uniref:uncharacterized protein LOC101454185 isoform X4 n=1 Tax=Ceratitis capitata TaxID=7213 RepID=UPI0006189669|nr:uncharacterized protein LOC101454185 isoform X4 [Ceratitis capitata]
MGYSSEAAKTRTQRSSIYSYKYKSNKNCPNTESQHFSNYNNNCNSNNTNNCCDNYKSSDINSLRLLSSEVICQCSSSADSDEEANISKESDNNSKRRRRRQQTTQNATTFIANKKTSKNEPEEAEVKAEEEELRVEKGGREEVQVDGAEAEETERQTQIECNHSEGVWTEADAVAFEELHRTDDIHCKLTASFVNNCTTQAIARKRNNSSNNSNNNNNNNRKATHDTQASVCGNFVCHTESGNNNCSYRLPLSREQLPQTRDALPPQTGQGEGKQQQQLQTQALDEPADANENVCATLSQPTETAAGTSAYAGECGAKSAAARNEHNQGWQVLLQQARSALTEHWANLRDNLIMHKTKEWDLLCEAEEEVTKPACDRGEATKTEQQQKRCKGLQSKCQPPLQLAYKRGRQQTAQCEQQQMQQKQQQRTDELQLAKCCRQRQRRRQHELKANLCEQRNAITYCHHHQQQQQQQEKDKEQQQNKIEKRHKKTSYSQQQQQQQQQQDEQQHHSPQSKPQKQQQQPQNQQQHQQNRRHRLRRGVQTAAAAAYGAFSYIGHNYYHLLGNSISFYAASSLILVLCYLTTTTTAAHSPDKAPFDKHPIQSIDWSKFDESSSDKEILDLLLEKKRYDKRLLPPVNDEDFCCGLSSPDMAKVSNSRRPHNRGTLTVNVNVLLLSLASPDESSLKYEVEFLLNQQWNDPRLQYGNKSHYDFLNALHHHDSIWTPDTYFIMHGDFKDPIIPMHFALRIYRNGTITYAMRRHLILSCQGSLHIFPFDDPKCSFSMESISYEEAQIKYVWKNDEDTLRKSPSLTTLNAYLIKNQTTPCDQNSWRGNYSCLEVELTFTRDRAYYFTTVFIPGIILVTSSFITFWLEWNAVPARVMIGVTTMLNFFTTSNGFRSTLPVVSNLTAMNVWDGVCMCFIYASLLEFVCVNYMGRKRPQHNAVYRPGENPVTQRLPAVLSRIGVILASPLATVGTSGSTTTGTSIPVTPTPMHPYHTDFTTTSTTTQSTAQTPLPPASPPPTGISTVDAPRIRWEEQHGGIIGVAMQNLRARSIRRRTRSPGSAASAASSYADTESGRIRTPTSTMSTVVEPVYTEPNFVANGAGVADVASTQHETTVTVEVEPTLPAPAPTQQQLQQRRSISTNTPPLILSGIGKQQMESEEMTATTSATDLEMPRAAAVDTQEATEQLDASGVADASGHLPVKPPRRKTSRSNSPVPFYEQVAQEGANGHGLGAMTAETGEKRRDVRAPNEIVACTTCGGSSSPCTHSANNGCATETCFVQVRKKEPPHPIRIAKTIDVIARITFPTAYAIFLIFFFVHYKGFS